MAKEKDPTIREKSLELADMSGLSSRYTFRVANALTSIAYSLIRYLDMDARYGIEDEKRDTAT